MLFWAQQRQVGQRAAAPSSAPRMAGVQNPMHVHLACAPRLACAPLLAPLLACAPLLAPLPPRPGPGRLTGWL